MRQLFCIFVALWMSSGFTAIAGVTRLGTAVKPGAPVLVAESAALFVGIRNFPFDRSLAEVKYAVDDAVDLAHLLAIESKPNLVEPRRVVLALSGRAQKPQSRRNLETLLAAGAVQRSAAQSDILQLLGTQARAVGPNGVLFVSFATHGISHAGTLHLLTASSLLAHYEAGSVTEPKLREIISRAGVARALILLDACRQRLVADKRGEDPDSRSAAALLRALGDINGQVVFSAAAVGDYAYDDDQRMNGVFTGAVMDALRCQASPNEQGFVTVDSLADYVERSVLDWVQKNRNHHARRATQLVCEGRAKRMPLAVCPTRSSAH